MKPENKAFLDANRFHADTLNRAGYLHQLSHETRSQMQRVFGEEFRPGYTSDLWCAVCVADMVKTLYQEYDKWLQRQVFIVPAVDEFAKKKTELIERWLKENSGKDLSVKSDAATKDQPIIPEPVKPIKPVKANFPSHKKGK